MTPRYRWVVLSVGAGGAAAFSALRMGLPALTPALRSTFGLSLTQVGLVLAAVSVGVMITLIPWGMLTDRIGERPVMAAGLTGCALALTAAAFATTFALLVVGLLAAGMFGASATGASGRAVMGWFDRSERGFALGIRQMAMPLGGALASLLLPHFVALGGLQEALLALAGLSLTAALMAAVFMRDAPPRVSTIEPPAPAPSPTRDRRIWRLGVAAALLVCAQVAMLGFLVLFLHDAHGVSVPAAAGALAAVQIMGAGARLVAGRRSDREAVRIVPMRGIAARNAGLLALVAVLAQAPGFLLYPVLLLAAVSTMSWNGLAFTAAAEISGRERAGTAMGVQNTILAFGAALAPLAFGALVAATSWAAAFGLLALAPAAAFVVLGPLVGDERGRNADHARRVAASRMVPA